METLHSNLSEPINMSLGLLALATHLISLAAIYILKYAVEGRGVLCS